MHSKAMAMPCGGKMNLSLIAGSVEIISENYRLPYDHDDAFT
jgi:hypothetical protein